MDKAIIPILKKISEKTNIEKQEIFYEMEEYQVRETIFRNGHGISTADVKLKIKSMYKKEPLRIMHCYDFGKCIRKKDFLPDLRILYNKKDGFLNRFCNKTFSFRSQNKGVKIKFDEYTKENPQYFCIILPPTIQNELFKKKMPLEYCWGVSASHMYPTKKSELQNLKSSKENDIFSSVEIIHTIKNFAISVDFERGFEFSKYPYFELFDGLNKKIGPEKINVQNRLYYDRYEIRNCFPFKGAKYKIYWVPK